VGAVTTGGQVYAPTPSFTFQDLGIVVTVTPHVHSLGEVTLDLDTEYKILGATSVNGLPIISGRKLQSTIRLKANEWAVIAGLTSESKSRTVSGPAFLSEIPLLGHIISHFTGNKANTYVIISMKPRVLSLPPEEKITHRVYLGSETRSITPL
jgi:type II secretory pathway component GspD/PulD (secretin)